MAHVAISYKADKKMNSIVTLKEIKAFKRKLQ